MLTPSIPAIRSQLLIGIGFFVGGIWIAWQLGGQITAGDTKSIILTAMGLAACGAAAAILRDWRSGLYLFLFALMFEDLARKYLGNGTALFFGKDVLLGIVYISFFVAFRKGKEKLFRPQFLLTLILFIWLAVVQIFNFNSPSIFYGLIGVKIYFYYIPLMYLGYAFLRHEEDLRKFLVVNALLAAVISSLGIAQAILGNSFLNPADLAPELQELGDLYKTSPLTHHIVSVPDSVFVSSGRYDLFLVLMTILMFGSAVYMALAGMRSRKLIFIVIGIVGGGVLLNGARSPVMYFLGSGLVLGVAVLWGAPWRQRQAYRSLNVVRRALTITVLALAAIIFIFPDESASRIALYSETLLPNSSKYEVGIRIWDYPIGNLLATFDDPHWIFGNGTGVCSLGSQYVAKFIGELKPNIGVEEGYGAMALEMGIIAPFLWLLWTAVLLNHSWKVVKRLRGTRLFPIAFAIFFYAFVLLYPLTYNSLAAYQNYMSNAYMWLLLGMLFRLPDFLPEARPQAAVAPKYDSESTYSAPAPRGTD